MIAKYLRVTIHDNDFTTSLMMVGKLLYDHFYEEYKYPTEEQLPMLKRCIKYLWFGAEEVKSLMRWGKMLNPDFYCFEPHLEFVDYADIPEDDNYESIYIPMFDNAEIILR